MVGLEGDVLEPNPFVLSPEQLVPPPNQRLHRQWLEDVIQIQREGIEHGVRPQIPDTHGGLLRRWRREVWRPYLSSQGSDHEEAALDPGRQKPGRQKHFRLPSAGGGHAIGGTSLIGKSISMPSSESQKSPKP